MANAGFFASADASVEIATDAAKNAAASRTLLPRMRDAAFPPGRLLAFVANPDCEQKRFIDRPFERLMDVGPAPACRHPSIEDRGMREAASAPAQRGSTRYAVEAEVQRSIAE
ncbi:MAG: hypothetical protein ABI809_05145 [Caldimonas sp.]